jgi:glycerate kinase
VTVALSVVIAPDSFKGTLSAVDVCRAIAEGWHAVRPDDELDLMPQADGGEGTLDAIAAAMEGTIRHALGQVTGPDGRPVHGEWLELPGGRAVVELAQFSGLPLMARLDPLGATTRGLGEAIRAVLATRPTSLIVGLGGSASTDGAAGALAALGVRFTDGAGNLLPDGGGALPRLAGVDRSDLVPPPEGGVVLLTDVTAPLLGPTGAAIVFGPQKGATPADVALLDSALSHFADLLGGDRDAPGMGAAGGAGFGFASAWGAVIRPGADHLAELTGLAHRVAHADVVLTGEGRFDEQSLGGKVVGQLIARAHGKAVGVIAGQISAPVGVWSASLTDLAGSTDVAMADTARWLAVAGARAAEELP